MQLHYMGFSVLALAPLQRLGERHLAIFGLAGLWNPTGSVAVEVVDGRLPLGERKGSGCDDFDRKAMEN